jgi:hypothetical protein
MGKRLLAGLLSIAMVASGLAVAVCALPAGDASAEDIEVTAVAYYAKPPSPPGLAKKDKEEPDESDGYLLLGIQMAATPQAYAINTDGAPPGAEAEIVDAFEAWDAVTATDLFAGATQTGLQGAQFGDGNIISWKKIVPRSTVAVTYLWHYTGSTEVLEFDMIFNTRHDWGIDVDDEGSSLLQGAFDVENVATHEVGHVVGLADLYTDISTDLTMYGYTSEGETGKISLEPGDIIGAQTLWGVL